MRVANIKEVMDISILWEAQNNEKTRNSTAIEPAGDQLKLTVR